MFWGTVMRTEILEDSEDTEDDDGIGHRSTQIHTDRFVFFVSVISEFSTSSVRTVGARFDTGFLARRWSNLIRAVARSRKRIRRARMEKVRAAGLRMVESRKG